MSAEKSINIFDYQDEAISQFRLCVDRFGDTGEKLYRLYCPYAIGYWEFAALHDMVRSIMDTNAAMWRKEQPEKIFSQQRGMQQMDAHFSRAAWKHNMLHTKRGSFYSVYIGFSLELEAEPKGSITIIDKESLRTQHSEAFHTMEELETILLEVEEIFAEARNVSEQRKLFRRYRDRKKKGTAAADNSGLADSSTPAGYEMVGSKSINQAGNQ